MQPEVMPDITPYIMTGTRYLLPFLAFWLLLRCLRSMLRGQYEPETWAWLVYPDGARRPVNHWDCIVGRARSSDVVLSESGVSRIHAALQRQANGRWTLTDLRSKGGSYINGVEIGTRAAVEDGDELEFGDACLIFHELDASELARLEKRRTAPGRFIGPGVTLLVLTLFQAFLLLQFTVSVAEEHLLSLCMAFTLLVIAEWFCYLVMRSIRRSGFEPETLAFFLTTLGLSVVASSAPEELFKQTMLTLAAIALFFILGWWLRDLRRVKATRPLAALAAMGLLAVNLAIGYSAFGAKNWLSIGGISIQPSEFVKVVYIYTGAATLDRLFARRNLFGFIAFSVVCVGALALMGDFGTALIFFATFLVIAFMRSGSFATVFLAVGGAGMAVTLILSVKPYIAQRFQTWGHAWDDVWASGYQQTRAMSAAASGGLFGRGAGQGWLKNIFAADMDMVFAMISEELGLLVAFCAVFALIALALFVVRNAAQGRSTFYVIAGCAAASLMLVQLALNAFGSLDILPFTGVTFPFVSRGGSSLLSCWMLLAFIKATDTRRSASFVVKPAARAKFVRRADYDDGDYSDDEYDDDDDEYDDDDDYDDDYDDYDDGRGGGR